MDKEQKAREQEEKKQLRRRTREAVRLFRMCISVEKAPKSIWSRDVENGMSRGCVSLAERIFALQMIALAAAKSWMVDLKRVFALLLVGEIDVARDDDAELEELYKDILSVVFDATYWGRELLEEFRQGATENARFALACMNSRNAWRIDYPRKEWTKPRDFDNNWGWGEECQKFFESVDNTLAITECAGWLKYGVNHSGSGGLETIAKHSVFSQLCAIAIDTVYSYGVDIEEVIFGCAIHHLPDAKLGVHTVFEKQDEAVDMLYQMMQFLDMQKTAQDAYVSYNDDENRRSRFAKNCGRIATDFVACRYDAQGRVNFEKIFEEYPEAENDSVLQGVIKDCSSFSEMFTRYSLTAYNYDENFADIAKYLGRIDQSRTTD